MSIPPTLSLAPRSIRASASEQNAGMNGTVLMYVSVGIGAALFFYLHLFHFPAVPIFHGGNQSLFLDHAEHMLHGEVLYRDLFQFNLPGTEYLYYILFRCFGVHLWIGAFALLLAYTTIALLMFSLSRMVLWGPAALLPVFTFLAICQRTSIDASHHWYSTTFVLLAINLIARTRKSVGIAVAGALLGMATAFTSSLGISVALGVSLFFLWKYRGWRNAAGSIATLLLPLAVVVGGTLMYLARLAGPGTLFQSVLVFPLRYYFAGDGNSFSVFFMQWKEILPIRPDSLLVIGLWCAVNAAVPIIFVVFVARQFRNTTLDRSFRQSQVLALYAFAGIFALLTVAASPSTPRLTCAAAFAYILATAMLQQLGLRRLLSSALALVCLVALVEMVIAALRPVYILNGPRGAVALLHQDVYKGYSQFARYAKPGDLLFGDPEFNFIFGSQQPTRIQWVSRCTPGRNTGPGTAGCAQATPYPIHHLVRSHTHPNWEDNLQPTLRTYLQEHYHLLQDGILEK